MIYRSTKTYGHEQGLSACFRQWRADSHCRFLHGYSLAFSFHFEAKYLDKNGWVVDFGALKPLKQRLTDTFDHKLLVARDDPLLYFFEGVHAAAADIIVVPAVGCEAFAKMAHEFATDMLAVKGESERVIVASVECREHAGNSAIYDVGRLRLDEWRQPNAGSAHL